MYILVCTRWAESLGSVLHWLCIGEIAGLLHKILRVQHYNPYCHFGVCRPTFIVFIVEWRRRRLCLTASRAYFAAADDGETDVENQNL